MMWVEKWLIVGVSGDVGDGMDSWYNIVVVGMKDWQVEIVMLGDLQVQCVAYLDWDGFDLVDKVVVIASEVIVLEFGLLPDIVCSKMIFLSELLGAKVLPGDIVEDDEDVKECGMLIYLLLEYLLCVVFADRVGLGNALVSTDMILMDSVIWLLDQLVLVYLWTDDVLTEVLIIVDLFCLGRIYGTIDWLILIPTIVLVVDYKINCIVLD